jgi:hypothetical protein
MPSLDIYCAPEGCLPGGSGWWFTLCSECGGRPCLLPGFVGASILEATAWKETPLPISSWRSVAAAILSLPPLLYTEQMLTDSGFDLHSPHSFFTCIARTSLGREGRHGVLSLFELFELERWKTACFDAACSQADVAKLQQEMRRSMPIRYSAGKAASDKEVRLRSIACGIVREWVRSSGVSLGVGRAYATGRAPVL